MLGEVSSLTHEVWDHAVEDGSAKVQRLPTHPSALFAGAKRTKVFGSFGYDLAK